MSGSDARIPAGEYRHPGRCVAPTTVASIPSVRRQDGRTGPYVAKKETTADA
jgi:hypothetical protein